LWTRCAAREAEIAKQNVEHETFLIEAAERGQRLTARAADPIWSTGMDGLQDKTFATFNRDEVRGAPRQPHPLDAARSWLQYVLDHGTQGSYEDGAPAPALYFHSPVYGCGKTHLAVALGWAARAAGWPVLFVDEKTLLRERWGVPFEQIRALINRYGDCGGLVIFDDIGRRRGTDSVQDVWDEVIDPRATRARWTIYTSNYTPDELQKKGTINGPTYSRLRGHIGGHVVTFVGTDQRHKDTA